MEKKKLTKAEIAKRWRDKKMSEGKCVRCGFEKEEDRQNMGHCEMCADSLRPAKNSQFSVTIRPHISYKSFADAGAKNAGLTLTEFFSKIIQEKLECLKKDQEKPEKSSDLSE